MSLKIVLTLIAIFIPLAGVSYWIGQAAYSWLPPQASAESLLIDSLFSFLVTIGAFIFLGVTGALVYSMLFQRVGKYDTSDGPPIEGNFWAEFIWTAIPLGLVAWISTYSFQVYSEMGILSPMEHRHNQQFGAAVIGEGPNDPAVGDVKLGDRTLLGPEDSSQSVGQALGTGLTGETVEQGKAIAETSKAAATSPIDVYARQWVWEFRYPNGVSSTELHLPANSRAQLRLHSEDVIHGFYIPAFRVKQDIIPNEITGFEFTPIREGRYRLRDSLYSGTYFAAMQTDVVVQSPEDYDAWLEAAAARPLAPAYNPAYAEYQIKIGQDKQPGWVTVPPAEPPLVNVSAPLRALPINESPLNPATTPIDPPLDEG